MCLMASRSSDSKAFLESYNVVLSSRNRQHEAAWLKILDSDDSRRLLARLLNWFRPAGTRPRD